MACRGVHFALTPDEARQLVGAVGDDDAIIELIQEEIEELGDREWLCETDKAWDAIHRCLVGGSLDSDGSMLSKCVLGGRQLHAGEDYIISYLEPNEVQGVAAALASIDKQWMRDRYSSITDHGYDGPVGDDDFSYTWDNFHDLREFFHKAAKAGRPIVFTVDLWRSSNTSQHLRRASGSGGPTDEQMGPQEVAAVVKSELARVEQAELAQVIERHLVPIRLEEREWDYGEAGESYPCWIVWEHAPSQTVVGYCCHGFGPAYPWGLLFFSPDTGLGMDAQWYLTLEDAVRASRAWDGDNPPGYEVG